MRLKVKRKTLAHEKQILKIREEYGSLAKMTTSRPPSRVTKQKLEGIRAEIKEIRTKENNVERQLAVKEKQFQLLMQSIYDQKSSLEEDKSRKELESEPKDSKTETLALMDIEDNGNTL